MYYTYISYYYPMVHLDYIFNAHKSGNFPTEYGGFQIEILWMLASCEYSQVSKYDRFLTKEGRHSEYQYRHFAALMSQHARSS